MNDDVCEKQKPHTLVLVMLTTIGLVFYLAFVANSKPVPRDAREVVLGIVVIASSSLLALLIGQKVRQRHAVALVQFATLYVLSFVVPAYYNTSVLGKSDPPFVGGMLGIFAFAGTFLSLVLGNPVWLANPFFWLGCVLFLLRKWGSAALAGSVSTAIAFSAPSFVDDEWLVILAPGEQRFRVSSGYYVWWASTFLLTAYSIQLWLARGTPNRSVR